MSSESARSEESKLPAYAATMAAYHRAFAPELIAILEDLPIRKGDVVLDFACGDGTYTRWLARLVGKSGQVIALDVSPAFLEVARRKVARRPKRARRVGFVRGDVDHVPIGGGSVDMVWCAQSLYSLPDPIEAIRRMAGVVRPGGHVAVFENDELHHVLLPWPVEIELALRKSELEAFVAGADEPRKFYVGRQLLHALRAAGLVDVRVRCVAFTRQVPLDPAARKFFAGYLEDLRDRAGPRLEPSLRTLVDRLTTPDSGQFLLDSPDLSVTCVNHTAIGVRP
ncbi:class I SAM-dependent methyltransferase [Aquisphaera insulae]|uniref:class I SAM-dependent methyltransferase n=1 Tax=Aquisphaera insulae TaxID=2712864 RepID=UPI0013EC4177|nr:class I SAM-dependent methyltransferase [Aquisphaera insulae]